jgi:cysteine desulfurase family protein (TIGR01976 family)
MVERTLSHCREDFLALSRQHRGRPLAFLDGPAGSQVPEAVIGAIAGYYRTSNANSGGYFPTSQESDRLLARAREVVATFLGATGGETISFGASMTTLTFALSRALARDWHEGDEIVVTALDHEGNRGPWLRLEERGIVIKEVALGADGRLDAEDFRRQVNERTRLVAVGAASNALGTVNDLSLARRLSAEVGALLVVDAVHYAPHFLVDVSSIDCDFLLCSAYKFYGPHVGVLYSRPSLLDRVDTDRLCTQTQSAPQRIETGTPNFAAIVGVAAAVEYLASWGEGTNLREKLASAMEKVGDHERRVALRCYERMQEIPGVTVWGPDFSGARAPTIAVTVEGRRPEEIASTLGADGIQVWDGDFYAIRAIESLGLAEAGGVLRTGVLMYNTIEEIDRLVDGVSRIAAV